MPTWCADDVNDKFAAMEKQEEIDRLLDDIKVEAQLVTSTHSGAGFLPRPPLLKTFI